MEKLRDLEREARARERQLYSGRMQARSHDFHPRLRTTMAHTAHAQCNCIMYTHTHRLSECTSHGRVVIAGAWWVRHIGTVSLASQASSMHQAEEALAASHAARRALVLKWLRIVAFPVIMPFELLSRVVTFARAWMRQSCGRG